MSSESAVTSVLADLRPSATALLLVDLQNDYLHPAGALSQRGLLRASPEARAAHLNKVRLLLHAARQTGLAVVWVSTELQPDLSDAGFSRPFRALTGLRRDEPFLVRSSWGAEVVEGLEPRVGEHHVSKTGHSGFQGTPLDRLLSNLGVRVCVVVGGSDLDGLPETIRQGAALGYELIVAQDTVLPASPTRSRSWGGKTAHMEDSETIGRIMQGWPPRSGEPIEPSRQALLVVDMQNHYMSGEGFKARHGWTSDDDVSRSAIIANTRRLLDRAHELGDPVIYLVTAGRPDGLDRAWSREVVDRVRPVPADEGFLLEGSWEAQVIPELEVRPDDFIILKKGSSGFGFTPLHRVLRNLRVTQCLLAGGSAHGCLEATWREGIGLGYEFTVVADATYPAGRLQVGLIEDRVRVASTSDIAPGALQTLMNP